MRSSSVVGRGEGGGVRLKTLKEREATNVEVDGDRKGFVVLCKSPPPPSHSCPPPNERLQRALENLETLAPLQPPPPPPSHPSPCISSS